MYLWLARWVIILPLAFLLGDKPPTISPSAMPALFVGALILSPVVETLLECTLVYQLGKWFFWKKGPRPSRPWGFIVAAALMMTVLHPINSSPLSFTTGAFLGYCYAHFAAHSRLRAFAFTTLYHTGINTVGVTLVALKLVLS
ncbi:MAG: hypothetical protein NTZ09_15840 [Candidatus Hydrogenedentes bacterium]|nr:hypothetical protein [Candidatus Hydrogenedentota bacterium]